MGSKTNGRDNEAIRKSLEKLAEKWPSTLVARSQIFNFSGGLVAPGTCANLDSEGAGIPGACRIGRQVVYPVESAIDWLLSRVEAQALRLNENSAASKQIKNEAQPQRTISDVLAKKENPELAPTGSGARQNDNLELKNTPSGSLDQGLSRGGQDD